MAINKNNKANLKLGIFGGTFNPLHLGHVNSIKTVLKGLQLDEIRVIPAYQSPGRVPVEGASPAQRLEMTKLCFDGWDKVVVDDREIRRGGTSYTIDTIYGLREQFPEAEFYLIVGMDQFESFGDWKDYQSVLSQSNLVITSRPDADLPQSEESFPPAIGEVLEEFDPKTGVALLANGTKIIFVQLDDVDISSTEVRKRIQSGESVEGVVPQVIREFIGRNKIYEGLGKRIGDFDSFTRFCAECLFERKGVNVQGYDVREINQPSEFVLIASGTSTRHATTLSEHVIRQVKSRYGVFPQSVEGQKEGRWIVLDYGSLIVHVFYDFTRNEYRLEELWKEAVDLNLKDTSANPQIS